MSQFIMVDFNNPRFSRQCLRTQEGLLSMLEGQQIINVERDQNMDLVVYATGEINCYYIDKRTLDEQKDVHGFERSHYARCMPNEFKFSLRDYLVERFNLRIVEVQQIRKKIQYVY